MGLGSSLFSARKKSGLSQEEVAEKLGVSRQTISKWELDETLPDIRQAKRLAGIYHLALDELLDFDLDVKEIQEVIAKTSDAAAAKIDWTKAWSQKYPILATYRDTVETERYAAELRQTLLEMDLPEGTQIYAENMPDFTYVLRSLAFYGVDHVTMTQIPAKITNEEYYVFTDDKALYADTMEEEEEAVFHWDGGEYYLFKVRD